MWLLLPFVILPIVEIALFIQVGGAIGVFATIGLVILSAVLGVAVMRRQGAMAMLDVQRSVQEFRDPSAPLAHGALIMLAGVLMVLPGLFTSSVGVLLLIPAVRGLVMRWMGRRVRVVGAGYKPRSADSDYVSDYPSGFGRGRNARDGVIDGEYSVQDDPPAPVREGLTDERPDMGPGKNKSGWTRH
ncbi:FxsA family protein [Paracoccus aestuariivivens]|uniref:FxsA family protein n=1 Tax=Paracoccus aestuariivivens TaxID=1820333 RepID=A0A6L6JC78_9RHOB|nr:FxsA family protein [Paracoccus aestuariivivens]MTH78237.1 FxsA family protein [Paracoccus aestuariivivens]